MNVLTRLLVVLLLFATKTHADLTLAAVFSDHAVLQRDQPLTIWGTANPSQTVRVRLGSNAADCQADGKGNWVAEFTARSASTEPLVLRVEAGGKSIERSGVLFGDVWHASGQSNMAMTVGAVAKSLAQVRDQLAESDFPEIRFLRIQARPSAKPQEELSSRPTWISCRQKTVPTFSAAAFFFAKKIHAELNVPIGIMDSSRGGTPIEPYIPLRSFTGHPTLEQELAFAEKGDLEGIWKMAGGVRARDENWLPGRLFHSRISPIARYGVRGCIWYQGESNCGKREDPRDYQFKMRALVQGWRAELGRPQLPFYFVQLPGSGASANWPYLREQQRLCADIEGTGMVVTIDLEDTDIHPANKVDVGERLAGWALAKEYGFDIPFCGPEFSKAQLDGKRMLVEFAHAESGLMVAKKIGLQPPRETPDEKLRHFELLHEQGNWIAAEAEIENGGVIVSSPDVDRPIAVRYAYGVSPKGCNLFSRNGLPAGPFCSRPDLLVVDPDLPD